MEHGACLGNALAQDGKFIDGLGSGIVGGGAGFNQWDVVLSGHTAVKIGFE